MVQGHLSDVDDFDYMEYSRERLAQWGEAECVHTANSMSIRALILLNDVFCIENDGFGKNFDGFFILIGEFCIVRALIQRFAELHSAKRSANEL